MRRTLTTKKRRQTPPPSVLPCGCDYKDMHVSGCEGACEKDFREGGRNGWLTTCTRDKGHKGRCASK